MMTQKMTKLKKWLLMSLPGLIWLLGGCQGLVGSSNNSSISSSGSLQNVKHIIFMIQENRSFDHYFGQLPAYWQANGFPAQSFDGLPANASNPNFDNTGTVSAFHLATVCINNTSPSWNESHVDWNRFNPTSSTATMDGFVYSAGVYARVNGLPDTQGLRAMGYYDGSDLNYYYFMASNFATSDRWFCPVMSRTQVNRMYSLAATSAGHVYPPNGSPLSIPTIFHRLSAAGVSWKIYLSDSFTNYLFNLGWQAFAQQNAAKIVPISQYFNDVANGTLPSVAMIEPGSASGTDEHPDENVATGAAYVSNIINKLMFSPSWKDSVFILTYDEGGGLYDHVPPQPAVSPDGIPPSDLQPGDICTGGGGANCDFTLTGFRVPLLVISPFTKKNFVSHTTADYTAILKLIETRFNLPSLTKRDAAQMDMTEFFDFNNVPWASPPNPPAQAPGTCDFQRLQ